MSRVLNGSPAVSERHPPARARLHRGAGLPAEPGGARAVDGPHHGGRRRGPVLHPALRGGADARRVARADGGGLPADPVRRRAARAGARAPRRTRPCGGRMDGVLCVSLAPDDAEAAQLEAARRAGGARRPGAPAPAVASPSTTSRAGGWPRAICSTLGHRRIAFVGDVEENRFGFDSSARRRQGFEEELAAAGVSARPGAAACCARTAARPRGRRRRSCCGRRTPPTAVFASSDVQAIGVLEAAQAAGVAVPEELSVIGFDNVEAAGYTGLTTIAQPLEESGALGADAAPAGAGRRAGRRPADGARDRRPRAPPGPARVEREGVRGTRAVQC